MTQHEVESMVSRESLARDILLKLLERGEVAVFYQGGKTGADIKAERAVLYADALLAELAKGKEG